MYALDTANPWTRDVLRARRRRPAWAVLLFAVVFSVAVLMIFKAQAPWLAGAIGGLLAGLPGAWPDVLTSAALQIMVFGLFLIAAMVAMGTGRSPVVARGVGAYDRPRHGAGRRVGGILRRRC